MKKELNSQLLLVCFAIVIGVAAFGSIFTSSGAKSGWYLSVKPAITPPDWTFGVVWTILFVMIALSLYFSWNSASSLRQREAIAIVYGFNLLANALWSFFFFGLQSARLGFIDIVLVWVSIIWAMKLSWKLDKKATWLLVPYLLWVTFAMVINFMSIH